MPDPSFWSGRRVLLTGHTGFKGCWLLIWLRHLGAEVWTFALEPEASPNLFREFSGESPSGEGWYHQVGDLSDLESLKLLVNRSKPEVVLHLAAQPLVRRSYEDPLGTWSTNVIGSLHLLRHCVARPHLFLVMVTTIGL